ncbi:MULTISPECIES: hypothetical protein [unclassified Mycolicibacterium]|uniref:hypothetical protein n=1 Tax=unclassified Mycolicibacterium TaxID=2636767 RepID=UPI002EDB7A9A
MKITRHVRPPRGLTGRVTGTPHRAVLEVVEHDRQTDSYVVASGWGSSAARYRNLFTRHALRHRLTATQLLPRVLDFTVDSSAADFEAVGRHLPFVRFVPRIPPA